MEKKLYRKSDLTNLVSQICGEIFYRTPVINNEMLNKNCLTGAATKSRAKLMDAMLNFPFNDLGFSGSGQEVSFMQQPIFTGGKKRKIPKRNPLICRQKPETQKMIKTLRIFFA